MPRIIYHVAPMRGGGWSVKRLGASRASGTYVSKGAAIRAASTMAARSAPAQVVIHSATGKIVSDRSLRTGAQAHGGAQPLGAPRGRGPRARAPPRRAQRRRVRQRAPAQRALLRAKRAAGCSRPAIARAAPPTTAAAEGAGRLRSGGASDCRRPGVSRPAPVAGDASSSAAGIGRIPACVDPFPRGGPFWPHGVRPEPTRSAPLAGRAPGSGNRRRGAGGLR